MPPMSAAKLYTYWPQKGRRHERVCVERGRRERQNVQDEADIEKNPTASASKTLVAHAQIIPNKAALPQAHGAFVILKTASERSSPTWLQPSQQAMQFSMRRKSILRNSLQKSAGFMNSLSFQSAQITYHPSVIMRFARWDLKRMRMKREIIKVLMRYAEVDCYMNRA